MAPAHPRGLKASCTCWQCEHAQQVASSRAAPTGFAVLQVLRLLIRLYESAPTSDWVSICQCLMFLDDAPEVAKILHSLLKGSEVRPGWCPDSQIA